MNYESDYVKIWFDNFVLKKWSHISHVMDSGKNLIGNLGRDQIWSMWIYKGHKITLLKVMDEKNHLVKCEGHFERFFHF